MAGAGNAEFGVSSWGWRGSHRVWRVYWDRHPLQWVEITGPSDASTTLVKAWIVRERLPWRTVEEE